MHSPLLLEEANVSGRRPDRLFTLVVQNQRRACRPRVHPLRAYLAPRVSEGNVPARFVYRHGRLRVSVFVPEIQSRRIIRNRQGRARPLVRQVQPVRVFRNAQQYVCGAVPSGQEQRRLFSAVDAGNR